MHNEELYHYGVKGMKWGVRTKIYTANTVGDYYTPKQKKKMTKVATKVLSRRYRDNKLYGDMYERAATSSREKSNTYNEKASYARSTGDIAKANKYQKKSNKALASYEHNMNNAKSYVNESKILHNTLDAIESGKLKAGKDFVTNSEYSTNLLLDAAGLINVRRQHSIKFS